MTRKYLDEAAMDAVIDSADIAWTFAASGIWSQSPYHQGRVFYYVGQDLATQGRWFLGRHTAPLDEDSGEDDAPEGNEDRDLCYPLPVFLDDAGTGESKAEIAQHLYDTLRDAGGIIEIDEQEDSEALLTL